MKKLACLTLLFSGIVIFSYAQIIPLEKYSAYRFYLSDKTKTGTGFKLRHFTNVKNELLFLVYNDRIAYTNQGTIVYKIYKIKRYADTTHYLVNDSSGQYFDIVISDEVVNKNHFYAVTVMKTDKNGNWLSLTSFDVKKIK